MRAGAGVATLACMDSLFWFFMGGVTASLVIAAAQAFVALGDE